MILSCISIIFILLSLFLSTYTLLSLINWNKAFKNWEKNIVKTEPNVSDADQVHIHDYVPNNFLIKDAEVRSIKDLKTILNLHSIINEHSIMVFLDKSCVFCNSNFEEFIFLSQESNINKNNIIIFFDKDQVEIAHKFNSLYDNFYSVFIIEDENFRSSLEAPFLPIYTKVNKDFNMILRTPSPFTALNIY